MADSSGSSTGIVAVLAIFVLVVLVGFFGMRSGVFDEGGVSTTKNIDVDVHVPAKAAPAPKAP